MHLRDGPGHHERRAPANAGALSEVRRRGRSLDRSHPGPDCRRRAGTLESAAHWLQRAVNSFAVSGVKCPNGCGAWLQFGTDTLGRTIESCPSCDRRDRSPAAVSSAASGPAAPLIRMPSRRSRPVLIADRPDSPRPRIVASSARPHPRPSPSPLPEISMPRKSPTFAPRTCDFCQEEFAPTGSKQRYCTPAHKDADARGETKGPKPRRIRTGFVAETPAKNGGGAERDRRAAPRRARVDRHAAREGGRGARHDRSPRGRVAA